MPASTTTYNVTKYDSEDCWVDQDTYDTEAAALKTAKDETGISGGYNIVERVVTTPLYRVSAAKKLTVKKIK